MAPEPARSWLRHEPVCPRFTPAGRPPKAETAAARKRERRRREAARKGRKAA